MMIKTSLTERFGLKLPLAVAPMGGGPTTPELVGASCNAGALGCLAGAYLAPPKLKEAIQKTRSLTPRPFLVNLFAPFEQPSFSAEEFQKALKATRFARERLALSDPELKPPYHENFEEQFKIILEEKPAAFSFVFGLISSEHLAACKKRGIYTVGTATSLEEGRVLENFGVDAVIAHGVDSGGHRAIFDPRAEDPLIGTLSLTRLLVREIRKPVIAAGGMMDGQSIAAALVAGAELAQLGTAFLACDEAGTNKAYRKALLNPEHSQTQLTRAFSGRLARGLENEFMKKLAQQEGTILPFPAQNSFTRDIRTQANQKEDPEFLSLWAGSGVGLIQTGPAAKIIQDLNEELGSAFSFLNPGTAQDRNR